MDERGPKELPGQIVLVFRELIEPLNEIYTKPFAALTWGSGPQTRGHPDCNSRTAIIHLRQGETRGEGI
jgi:hypothetical protein